MTTTTILPPASRGAASGGFRIDPSRGERSARVSSEWFSRPDDERYLSLSDLHAATLDALAGEAAGQARLRCRA